MNTFNFTYAGTRKKHQRKVNKLIREFNKALEEDDYWKGRFRINQLPSQLIKFEDGSGLYLRLFLEMYDKKTNKSCMYIIDESDYLLPHIAKSINDFITVYLDTSVAKEPREEVVDTRHITSGKTIRDYYNEGNFRFGR